MRAVSESEVRVRVTVRPERLGVVEHLRVAVGGRQDERDPLAGADRPPAELDVVRRRAGEALVGRVEPKQLLDARRRGPPVASRKRCLQPGVARQVQDGAPDQRRRRDVRGDQQLPEAARDELVVERLAVDPRREQRARRIELGVERRGLALGDDLPAGGVEALVLALGGGSASKCACAVLEPLAARVRSARRARAAR